MLVKRDDSRTYVGGRGRGRKLLHKVFKTLTCHLGVCSCGSRAELGMRTHRRNQAMEPNRALGARRNAHRVFSNKGIHLLCSCVTAAKRGTEKCRATPKYNHVLRSFLGSQCCSHPKKSEFCVNLPRS